VNKLQIGPMLNLDCLQTYKNRDQIGAHLKPVRRQMVISGSANYSLNCTISLIAFNCLRFPNCFHCALVRLLFLFFLLLVWLAVFILHS